MHSKKNGKCGGKHVLSIVYDFRLSIDTRYVEINHRNHLNQMKPSKFSD